MERSRKHLTVPELTCESCQALAGELEEARKLLRKQSVDNTELVEKWQGALAAAEAAGRSAVAAKGQRTKQAKADIQADKIERVIECWRDHRPKTSATFGEPGSRVWEIIAKALVLMAKDEKGDVQACCEAIDGLHLAPWQEFDKRYATPGPNRQLRNGIEHALGDDVRIARCRRIAQRARDMMLADALLMYEVTGVAHDAWARVYLDAVERRRDLVEVDGVVTLVEPTDRADDVGSS